MEEELQGNFGQMNPRFASQRQVLFQVWVEVDQSDHQSAVEVALVV
jgi:hypothetical protein